MPKYLITGSYGAEGAKGLLNEGGTARRDGLAKLCADLGGELEACYFAFGKDDAYAVVDLPDPATMTALTLVMNASGAGRVSTTVLVTPEEVDQATRKSIQYRPPTP
jgi:uncharacterized protein with GYD domain